MKPPPDSPQATIFLVFGNSVFQIPINSTLVLRALSVFQPALEKPEEKTPYPFERRYVATATLVAASGPGACSANEELATSDRPGIEIIGR